MAAWTVPPYKARCSLAKINPRGYIAPNAAIHHKEFRYDGHVFVGDRVVIFQTKDGGAVELYQGVHLYSDIIIETGAGGEVVIGDETHIQPRCQLSAYKGSIRIGRRVEIAPNCSFYPYNHGVHPGEIIRTQPFETKGDIVIGDDAWLGVGVIVLDNVKIGKGAVIGAGSIVTRDVPDNAIAMGAPAKVVKMRDDYDPDEVKVKT
ncbi:MAG: acyltransferase [Chloroflexi bacterium]|nr:acyltransferase [Chloroflexota bacterium]